MIVDNLNRAYLYRIFTYGICHYDGHTKSMAAICQGIVTHDFEPKVRFHLEYNAANRLATGKFYLSASELNRIFQLDAHFPHSDNPSLDFTFPTDYFESASVKVKLSIGDHVLGVFDLPEFIEFSSPIAERIVENGKYLVNGSELVISHTGLKNTLTDIIDQWYRELIYSEKTVTYADEVPVYRLYDYIYSRLAPAYKTDFPGILRIPYSVGVKGLNLFDQDIKTLELVGIYSRRGGSAHTTVRVNNNGVESEAYTVSDTLINILFKLDLLNETTETTGTSND